MAKKSKVEPGDGVTASALTVPSGLLAAAVQATQTGAPCFASLADISPLLTTPHGQLVEYNEAIQDANGFWAVRATAIGVQVYQSNGNGAAPQTQTWPATVGNPGDYEQPELPQTPFPQHPQHFGQGLPAIASAPVVGSHTATTPRPVFKKGIPIPPPRAKRESTKKYAFDKMEIGDCFDTMVTGDSPEPWKKLTTAATAASKRFAPKKFETWPIVEDGVKFARTWRTA